MYTIFLYIHDVIVLILFLDNPGGCWTWSISFTRSSHFTKWPYISACCWGFFAIESWYC